MELSVTFFTFEKDFFSVHCSIGSGGSRNSGKGVHTYKGVGLLILSHFS